MTAEKNLQLAKKVLDVVELSPTELVGSEEKARRSSGRGSCTPRARTQAWKGSSRATRAIDGLATFDTLR